MDSESIDQAVGFYGKLPSKGDFLTRSLPREFVALWDDWLQTGMNASREVLGSNWLDTYLTSPLWRFALSPGICGAHGWAGLMLPSMDRVGRYFPFTIARPLPEHKPPLAVAADEAGWFDRAAAMALAALDDDDKDPADLYADLVALNLDLTEVNQSDIDAGPVFAPANFATGVRLSLGEDLDSSRLLTGMACAWLDREMENYGLWWTEGSDLMSPSMLCHPGLPETTQFCALLDGRWTSQGWSDLGGESSSTGELQQSEAPGETEEGSS